ncbi:MAG: PfkB family carbohydrate kinase [Bryobacteraceae bacterium]|jgi:sugar/nucleoside kinase (ribokinase family)
MRSDSTYDVVVIGNYTKDTIISPSGTRQVDGGGFNYGAHVASMMGLKAAAVTRLSREDMRVVDTLTRLGVTVYPTYTSHSTDMRLYYPTTNMDERVLSVTHTAGAFTSDQIKDLESKAFLINSSIRGEVDLSVIRELRTKNALLAADVQGFIRIIGPEGALMYDGWPEKLEVLSQIDILKTDAVEAEKLTGKTDIKAAARMLAGSGPKEIVVTQSQGVLVFAGGQFHEAPFCPQKLVGRSGRGDTCIGSYVCKRLSASPQEATIWAAAVTSLKMEADGPITRKASEVEELIARMYAASAANHS